MAFAPPATTCGGLAVARSAGGSLAGVRWSAGWPGPLRFGIFNYFLCVFFFAKCRRHTQSRLSRRKGHNKVRVGFVVGDPPQTFCRVLLVFCPVVKEWFFPIKQALAWSVFSSPCHVRLRLAAWRSTCGISTTPRPTAGQPILQLLQKSCIHHW
jgi:hypothetical protein